MKYISKELNKNYKKLIVIFFISYIGIIGFYSSYMYKNIKNQIRTIETFINYEFLDFEKEIDLLGESPKIFFEEALDESPKPDMTIINLEYEGINYFYMPNNFIKNSNKLNKDELIDSKEKLLKKILNDSNEMEPSTKIRNYMNYKYKILYKKVSIAGMKPMKLKIIKDMSKEYERLGMLGLFSIIWIFITFLIASNITKKFYRKFSDSIEDLHNSTNKINLNSLTLTNTELDKKLNFNNEFEEFNLIKSSYIDMVKRLKLQMDAQIDFVNNASHELKTPLFIISGYIDMIKRWGIEDKEIVLDALSSIEDENKNMISLVEKLLFLAKNKEFKRKNYEEFNISENIKNTIGSLKVVHPDQKISLNLSQDNYLIFSDKSLLNQLILNLLENAIKYGEDKPIEVSLEFDNNYIIKIKDHGIGISEEDLKFVFDKFYRADKSRNKNMGGHGLGLTIVKEIVDFLKGEIYIESEVGKGTEVKLIIPKGIEKGVD
ncbi:sensor histidine kinase [Fusobacterium sp. MFO224]|uniref:sensor histidine kinase n=1 Tax=Fusobacterium sp. MFO224 TaxID=3378070 RepID=UPI003853AF91